MEAINKGWTPNLAPLKSPAPSVPIAPIPAPVPAPTQIPIQNPVRSYSSDFIQKMKDTHASTATVLAAEQDAATSGVPQDPPEKYPRRNIIYTIAGAVLLILGITGSYIAYTRYLANVEPIIILAPAASIPIFVDEKEKISGTSSKEILQAIKQSVTRSLAPNTIRFLYIDDDIVFSALKLPAPGALLRNINASGSMAGIANVGGSQNPFFILSVASYSDTFAGMLSWESKMPRDLSVLFPSYPPTSVGTTTVATSTSVVQPQFRDEVVSNHDARVYRDAEGRSVLLYSYWNQTTLVIARDSLSFVEIIRRLSTARAQR